MNFFLFATVCGLALDWSNTGKVTLDLLVSRMGKNSFLSHLSPGSVSNRSELGVVCVRDYWLPAGVWSAPLPSQPTRAAVTHPAALLQPHNTLRAQNQVRKPRLWWTWYLIFARVHSNITLKITWLLTLEPQVTRDNIVVYLAPWTYTTHQLHSKRPTQSALHITTPT